jgi:hypothetical protein
MKEITLKTLSQTSAQEVFDFVSNHLLRQGVRSTTFNSRSANNCVYRGDQGRSCAAGCLIGDHEYSDRMEGLSWDDLARSGRVPRHHIELITELQKVHDLSKPEDWPSVLSKLALSLGLNYACS